MSFTEEPNSCTQNRWPYFRFDCLFSCGVCSCACVKENAFTWNGCVQWHSLSDAIFLFKPLQCIWLELQLNWRENIRKFKLFAIPSHYGRIHKSKRKSFLNKTHRLSDDTAWFLQQHIDSCCCCYCYCRALSPFDSPCQMNEQNVCMCVCVQFNEKLIVIHTCRNESEWWMLLIVTSWSSALSARVVDYLAKIFWCGVCVCVCKRATKSSPENK